MPSVVDQTPFNEYIGDGVSTVFPYEFQLLAASDLVVSIDGVVIPSSSFTLTGVGVQAGGTVTFTTAPLNGSRVLLSREIALRRDIDYQNNGDMRSPTVNLDFNRLWQALQGFFASLGGALRVPFPEQIPALPVRASRANQVMAFDANGDPTVMVPASGSAADVLIQLADPTKGDSLIGVRQPFAGSVPRSQHDKNSETLSIADFLTGAADGVVNNTADLQNAINAASGKRLIGVKDQIYLVRDQLVIPSNVEIDWQGATIIDDVRTFREPDQGGRAKPLFYIYGVHDVGIKNFTYRSTTTRATVSNDVPTGIIWIGDNSTTGNGPTFNIEVSGITASDCADHSLFVGVVGNVFNVDVKNIIIEGDCSYGFNAEYGEAPSDTDRYGMHPYNIRVENFNGSNNPTSVGFLRVASTYNVEFLNCYGKDVANFILAWTGDRSISRVSQNVTFRNCKHYASDSFLSGVINYCCQVLVANKDGSTGEPLPIWTNYHHSFTFDSCEFQNNKTEQSAVVRFYGNQGSTVFRQCIIRNSYYGIRAEPGSNPDYRSEFSLSIIDCTFINNSRDILLSAIMGVVVKHNKFTEPDNTLSPIKLENSALYNKISSNIFSGSASDSYIVVDAGCARNEISQNLFGAGVAVASLDLRAETLGGGNSGSPAMCRSGWDYFGLQGQPETMYQDLSEMPGSEIDASRRRQFAALTGAVSKSINSIIGGRLGDEVVFQSISNGASVTFVNAAPVGTLNRLFTQSGSNVTKTGNFWTARAKLTELGWLLSD